MTTMTKQLRPNPRECTSFVIFFVSSCCLFYRQNYGYANNVASLEQRQMSRVLIESVCSILQRIQLTHYFFSLSFVFPCIFSMDPIFIIIAYFFHHSPTFIICVSAKPITWTRFPFIIMKNFHSFSATAGTPPPKKQQLPSQSHARSSEEIKKTKLLSINACSRDSFPYLSCYGAAMIHSNINSRWHFHHPLELILVL